VAINTGRCPDNFSRFARDSIHQAIMFLTDALKRFDDANR